jgi:hypothetical protein
MAGFFHKISERMQSPMLFEQFGERVRLSSAGESALDETKPHVRTLGIIRVTQSENGDGGKAVILRAECVLRVGFGERIGPPFTGWRVEDMTTTQTLAFRDQLFSIESMSPVEAGTRKVICTARRNEFTNRSTLNGRL